MDTGLFSHVHRPSSAVVLQLKKVSVAEPSCVSCAHWTSMYVVFDAAEEQPSVLSNHRIGGIQYLSIETTVACSMGHFSDTNAPLYKDHLSIVTTVACSMGHFSDTNAPLYKDHLSTETTVACSMGHFSDTNAPLYKDHLSTETTVG